MAPNDNHMMMFFFSKKHTSIALLIPFNLIKPFQHQLSQTKSTSKINTLINFVSHHPNIHLTGAFGQSNSPNWAIRAALRSLIYRQIRSAPPINFRVWSATIANQEDILNNALQAESSYSPKWGPNQGKKRVPPLKSLLAHFKPFVFPPEDPIMLALQELTEEVWKQHSTGSLSKELLNVFVDPWNKFPALYHLRHKGESCKCLVCQQHRSPWDGGYPKFENLPSLQDDAEIVLVTQTETKGNFPTTQWPRRGDSLQVVVAARITTNAFAEKRWQSYFIPNSKESFWDLEKALRVLQKQGAAFYARISQSPNDSPLERVYNEIHHSLGALHYYGFRQEPYALPVFISPSWGIPPNPNPQYFNLHPTVAHIEHSSAATLLQKLADTLLDLYHKQDWHWMDKLVPLFQDPDIHSRHHLIHQNPSFSSCSCPVCRLHRQRLASHGTLTSFQNL